MKDVGFCYVLLAAKRVGQLGKSVSFDGRVCSPSASPHYERVFRLATANLKRKFSQKFACAFTGYSKTRMNIDQRGDPAVEKCVHHGRKMRPVAIGMVRPPTYTFSIRVPWREARACMRLGRRISMPC